MQQGCERYKCKDGDIGTKRVHVETGSIDASSSAVPVMRTFARGQCVLTSVQRESGGNIHEDGGARTNMGDSIIIGRESREIGRRGWQVWSECVVPKGECLERCRSRFGNNEERRNRLRFAFALFVELCLATQALRRLCLPATLFRRCRDALSRLVLRITHASIWRKAEVAT